MGRFASQSEAEARVAELEARLAAVDAAVPVRRRRRRRTAGIKCLEVDANGLGRWQLDWRPFGIKGPRKRLTIHGTREDAEKHLAARRAERANLRAGVVTARRLGEAVQAYLQQVATDHREGHLKNVRRTLDLLAQSLPDQATVEAVTYGMLINWRSGRQAAPSERTGKPRSARSVNRELAEVRAFLQSEVDAGRLLDNPAARLKALRCDAKPGRWLTPAEYTALWQRASEPVRDAMDVLVALGLRLGELLRLRQEHIRGAVVEITGRKARDFLNLRVGPALLGVLCPRVAAPPWPRLRYLSRHLARLAQREGLPRLGAHALRHSCATWMLAAGVDVYRVKSHLGHASVMVTEGYSRYAQVVDWQRDSVVLPSRTHEILSETVSTLRPQWALKGEFADRKASESESSAIETEAHKTGTA